MHLAEFEPTECFSTPLHWSWYLSSESINAKSVPGTLAVIQAWAKTQVPLFFFYIWDVRVFFSLLTLSFQYSWSKFVYMSIKLLLKNLPCALLDFFFFFYQFLVFLLLGLPRGVTSCDKSLEVLLTNSWKHAPCTESQPFYGIIKALFYSPSK